jgi:hypothetical protein
MTPKSTLFVLPEPWYTLGDVVFKTEVSLNKLSLLMDIGIYLLIVTVRVNLNLLYGGIKTIHYV